MPLEPGRRLGPYEIRALLGVGGMGEVYRGRDTRLGRDVALKVISPALVGNESSRHRFEREARAASALNHPAIVTVYDVGETDGVSWIAMEWVEGRTLRQALEEGPRSVDDAWSIARQVALGLAAAHAKGVVHRDLKPENVMLATDGRVRILDFGLARQTFPGGLDGTLETVETTAALGATVDGVILGTIGYMSPEQAAAGPVDFRSDQFSCGLLLYEMLAGRRAFARSSAVETLWATIREEPAALSSFRDDIPEALDLLVRRTLAKKREDRFNSTADLVAALDAAAPAVARASTAPTAPTVLLVEEPPPAVVPAARTRRAGAMAGTALALALVLALAGFIWKSIHSAGPPITSLAVLPFDTGGGDADSAYLGEEFTESLINQLSRVKSLTVMARATVLPFKGADPLKAGRQLPVGAVLTGRIVRRGTQLAVSAELVDVASGARLWGGTYTRPSADLLHLQDTITSEISDKLRLDLSGEQKRALGGQGTDDPDAYELFLRARHLLLSESEEDDLEARRLYLESARRDPRFVDAYLGAASTFLRSASDGYSPPDDAWPKVDELLAKVRDLDPRNPGLRVFVATRHFLHDWNWNVAEREFLDLSDEPFILQVNRYHPVAMFFWARGWPDRAVGLLERALRVDPGNLESRIMLADFLTHAGRPAEAANYYRAIVEVAPADSRPLFGLAEVLKQKGDVTEAIDMLRRAYASSGEEVGTRALAGARTEEDYDKAQLAVARSRLADLKELAAERYVSPLDLARACAQAGERDQSFTYLERAVAERSHMVVLLKVDAAWDRIRSDARFAAIVRRVGIP